MNEQEVEALVCHPLVEQAMSCIVAHGLEKPEFSPEDSNALQRRLESYVGEERDKAMDALILFARHLEVDRGWQTLARSLVALAGITPRGPTLQPDRIERSKRNPYV